MKKAPRITEAEWTIMKQFWPGHRLTSTEVIVRLKKSTDWHPATIKSLLNRLLKKRALGYEREGRGYCYHARVAEEDCLGAETASFLSRFFGGSVTPMLAHFLEEQRLSPKEIAELRRLLKEKTR